MTAPRPAVDCEKVHPSIPVADVAAAVEFYTKTLGFSTAFTWPEDGPPTMAGLNLGDVQVFVEKGQPNPEGWAVYFVVGNVDALHAFQKSNGVEIVRAPMDQPYGLRDYAVKDLYGNHLGFGQYIYTVGEPIEIERVDVPVRLEKRLAALLTDLAAHKRLSVSSCLEEMLLHTNDGVGPHTNEQLRAIRELKKKHSIDYDTHGSYRFVEKKSG